MSDNSKENSTTRVEYDADGFAIVKSCRSVPAALAEVARIGADYAEMVKHHGAEEEAKTVGAVRVTREALKVRAIKDGRRKASDFHPQAISKQAFAARFGLTTGTRVTEWEHGAHLLDIGVKPGSDVWALMFGAKKGLQSGKVREIVMATGKAKDLLPALEKGGVDLATMRPKRQTNPNPGSGQGGGNGDGEDGQNTGATTPDKVAARTPEQELSDALDALDAALKRVISPELWVTTRDRLTKVIAQQNQKRTPVTKHREPKPAALAPTGTDA